MKHYFGAQYNLKQLIDNHLFIICPNNSGSTFLKNVLATSQQTWNLDKEGQHSVGFAGPNTRSLKAGLVWSTRPEWVQKLTDKDAYDWPKITKAWYFCSFGLNPNATVFITKSPPFLLSIEKLHQNFKQAKFIFMVRNPYAVIEGICRNRGGRDLDSQLESELRAIASQQIVNCLAWQKQNLQNYGQDNLFFTYEQMCDQPQQTEQKIKHWLPILSDLTLQQTISVKGQYDEPLRNMNAQQIQRLTQKDIKIINQVLRPHQDLLAEFGYGLLEEN
jgi:hypothetical protein